MKHRLIVTLILLFTFVFAEGNQKLGEALKLEKATNVSTLLESPDSFIDERVQISGTIVDVCAHRGCWIEMSGDQPFQSIIVKVNDGEIVFPLTAKGHQANVEGIFEKLTLSDEQALKRKEMLMEEAGKSFDPEKDKITDEDRIIYRLKGLGAEIQD
ncbi:MAG: DUF4920 domain-containing protein [Candidatus Marinimicrobia bacterium]|nr:DUF4920 domain-containing protein [Candidatus Neomarinimicrobiota bacterium]